MKITFAPEELNWLNTNLIKYASLLQKRGDSGKLPKLTRRLGERFGENAKYVSLDRNELRVCETLVTEGARVLKDVTLPEYQKRGQAEYQEYIDKAAATLAMLEALKAKLGTHL